MRKLIQLAVLFAVPAAAYAVTPVPEPETFGLLAIGAVALVLSTVRRKK